MSAATSRRAYPSHLASEWRAPDGTLVTVRPIRPEDADIEREFVRALSNQARYLRFMGTLKELTPEMLERFTHIDYDREMALIGVICEDGREIQIAVARYIVNTDDASCEFAVVVADRFQGRGLGQHLMLRLIELARARRLKVMNGYILAINSRMLALAKSLGFTLEDHADDPAVARVRLSLSRDA